MAEPRAKWRPTPFLIASAGIHGASLATVIAAPRLWAPAAAAVIANHVVAGTVGVLPRSTLLGANVRRIPDDRAGNAICLTFDDGPDPDMTPRVLDRLDRANAHATFFCIGERAEKYPELIAAIRDRGHGIENHSYSHPNLFSLMGPGGMKREVTRAQDAIERTSGRRPLYFRAPAGVQSPWLGAVLASADLSLVSWTRRGFDTVSDSGARVAARLTANLKAGDILLLHDGYASSKPRNTAVVLDALDAVLETMREKNLISNPLHATLGRPSV